MRHFTGTCVSLLSLIGAFASGAQSLAQARNPDDNLPLSIPAEVTKKPAPYGIQPTEFSPGEPGGRRLRSSTFHERTVTTIDEPPVPVWPLDAPHAEPLSAAVPTCAVHPTERVSYSPLVAIADKGDDACAGGPSLMTIQAKASKAPANEIKFVSIGSTEATPLRQTEPAEARPAASSVRMVNNKRFSISYELKDVGPSGVSQIDLWYTADGQSWERAGDLRQTQSPYVVNVDHEGRYGLTMVARSGIGLGGQPPRTGDAPQIWVEVDTTKPVVTLLNPKVNLSASTHHLIISWTATDKNLIARPITLAYAEQASGPWLPIASKIENTGRYVWQIPDRGSHRFLVRVEATDLAGNVGVAQTPEPILLDLAQPTVSIVGVEPAGR